MNKADKKLLLKEVYSTDWAILPERLNHLCEQIRTGETAQFVGANVRQASLRKVGSVAIIPVTGEIMHRSSFISEFFGFATTDKISAQVKMAANDPEVKTILLDVDSPGGTVPGVEELADLIRDVREVKKVVSVANSLSASAAFWISSQANEAVSIPSGSVGSVGVFAMHEDWSEALAGEGIKVEFISAGKFKVEGNPFEPLTSEARAQMQDRVDKIHDVFIKSVAKGRGVSASTVRSGFGEGRVMLAPDAKKMGMIDSVRTLDQVLVRAGAFSVNRTSGVRAHTIETIRDFESFLKEEGGFSNKAAKEISENGFKPSELQLPGEGDSKSVESRDDSSGLSELSRSLKELQSNLEV